MRIAFSTSACPEWTIETVAAKARAMQFDGVEFRSFGPGSTEIACDPMLSEPRKIDRLFSGLGLTPLSISTSLSFDEPIRPPVIGRVLKDQAVQARKSKRFVQHASAMDCPFVRVFAFQTHGKESAAAATKRIVPRLYMAVDGCAKTGVRLLLENGGSFRTAADLKPLVRGADLDGLLAVSYSVPVGRAAGESLEAAMDLLGEKLQIVKIKDFKDGAPAIAGEGDQDVAGTLDLLASRDFRGWVVYEHDRLWMPDAISPETALEPLPRLFADVLARHREPEAAHAVA
ncbi:MAG: hypothetical protein EA423_08895 [Phycisphaerales bacterium]|nr:MAG: hypothetical protein EA423_08895 [Phycisphaerales bacterium]